MAGAVSPDQRSEQRAQDDAEEQPANPLPEPARVGRR